MCALYTLSNDHVAKYNPRTKFYDKIKIGNGNSYFYDFALDGSSDNLFISDCKNSMIYTYNTRHNALDSIKSVRAPTYLEVGQDMPLLFAISEISQFLTLVNYKSIFAIEPRGHKVIATLPSGRNPVKFVASPDCRALYIIDREKDSGTSVLYKIDVSNKKVAGSLALNSPPGGMAISPDGQTIYISLTNEARIVVVGANSLSIDADIPVQDTADRRHKPGEMVVSPDGKKLYVTTASNIIAVIDLETHLPSMQIETKFNARTMAIDPVENLLYVACQLVDILVIDMRTDSIVKRMTIEPGDIKKIIVSRS
jgi:DNA-binding beta-propeller fold protein YncE